MYYRYEAEVGSKWVGICQAMTPDHRRKIGRFLHEPKWYGENPDVDSECWFTEYGYNKYHEQMEEVINNCCAYYFPLKTRLRKSNTLDNIAMQSKVQCICLI